ncbi:MAG: ankyrin repeat domain-containing protein, partial [Gammaproteobacteria bacterium]
LTFSGLLLALCCVVRAEAVSSDRLYEAIVNNQQEMIGDYLEAGGDPNAWATKGEWSGSLLEVAVRGRRDAIATALLAAGADTALAEESLSSSLTKLALEQGMDELLARLLDANPRELVEGNPAESPLVDAARNGRYDAVLKMLGRAERLNLNWGNRLAIAFQSAANYEDIARVLLKAGLDPAAPGLLHAAVNSSGPGLVHDLIEAGASPSKEVNGRTPLDVAVARLERSCSSHGELVLSELVDAGVDPCYLSRTASRLSPLTLNWLHVAAPQCDWPMSQPAERPSKQQYEYR